MTSTHDNPTAWAYLGYPHDAAAAARRARAEVAARRAERRALFCKVRALGAPHTWPVFAGLVDGPEANR